MDKNQQNDEYFSSPTSDKSKPVSGKKKSIGTKSTEEYLEIKSGSYTEKKAYAKVIGYVEKQDSK